MIPDRYVEGANRLSLASDFGWIDPREVSSK